MPTAIDLTIRAGRETGPTITQVHGLACSLLEGPNADHQAQTKPWTAWPPRSEGKPHAGGSPAQLILRLNWLDDRTPPALAAELPDRVRLGGSWFPVAGVRFTRCSYEDLASGPPFRSARLDCHRPTYFSRNGRDLPMPDPVLVVRSLGQRWNAFAPGPLVIDTASLGALESSAVLTEMDGCTESVSEQGRALRTGFVGHCTIGLLSHSPQASVYHFSALIRAAEYLGIGAGTTRGFGVVTGECV